jgi:type I pantothenate kinase
MDELAQLIAERMAATDRRPFLIGIAGSVAVGKSTIAEALRAQLAEGPGHPTVAVVPTDGFLLPNAVLDERGIGHRKGFPESYDTDALIGFLGAVRDGRRATAPVYDHVTYDVLADEEQVVDGVDVVIVEGINALQVDADRYDVAVYVDADEADVVGWFVDRLVGLWTTTRDDPGSFFHPFATTSEDEVRAMARAVWDGVNGPNLHEHIAPSRDQADVIVDKGPGHGIRRIVDRRS